MNGKWRRRMRMRRRRGIEVRIYFLPTDIDVLVTYICETDVY